MRTMLAALTSVFVAAACDYTSPAAPEEQRGMYDEAENASPFEVRTIATHEGLTAVRQALAWTRNALDHVESRPDDFRHRGVEPNSLVAEYIRNIRELERDLVETATTGSPAIIAGDEGIRITTASTTGGSAAFGVFTRTNHPATITHSGTISWSNGSGPFGPASSSGYTYQFNSHHVTGCPGGNFTVSSTHVANFVDGQPTSDSTSSFGQGSCDPDPEYAPEHRGE